MSSKKIGVILDVDAEVSKAKSNISSLSKIFDGIGGKQGSQLRDILADINTEYSKLADESGKTMGKIGDFSKAEKSLQKLDQLFGKLEKELGNIDKMSDSDLSKLFPPEVAERIKKASDAIKTYNTYMENSAKNKGVIGQATKEYEDQEKAVKKAAAALKELESIQKGQSKKQVVSAETKAIKTSEVKAATAELNQYEKELVEAQQKMEEFKQKKAELFSRGTQNKSSEFRQLRDDLEAAEKNFNDATTKASELKRELKNMVIQGDLDNEIKDAERALEDAQTEAKELKKNLEDIRTEEMTKAFDQAKDKLKELANIDLNNLIQIDDIIDLFKRFQQDGIEGVTEGVEQLKSSSKDLGNVTKDMGDKVAEATDRVQEQNKAMGEIQGIKNRVLEFFSLNNAMQLAQQAMRQTFQTIKELDAAMTETAVVTDFSVGDMWDALPRYTKAANELGTTTLGAYETMTLFYQQGLDTNEAFAIGTETMKMARIAGLDYAEATDLMTAALRGFNMELNETSAQRINDVYSELAAITAADTEEIATAMTKTASIAKSANMEFETTAAFLSQIIETTREPAETAGTAMKTIIARFTEMKKATSDVINFEGEEINVNKVEEALRSAGVALRDVNGEFRDTDDVFLELASKWDNLDIMTQRYIATMAAGSRQQSRFLAMMQDYDRTIELIDAAYSSSGASQAQFLKTQDSLESKLNKLKNAWNEFLMGITNSKAIKVGVDLLTGLLNIINKLTGNSGLGKLTVALGAIFGGKIISNKIFGNIGSSIATSFLKPLADAGMLADNVASKIKGLGSGSLWQQVKNGVGAFVKGLTTAGSVAGALLPILAAVAAVLAVIGAAWYFSDEQVETRKLKEAQELAADLAEGLEDAREAVATIASDRSGLETLKNELKELVVGTEEWRLKLLEVQAEESKLIGKYNLGNVGGAIQVDQYGNQTITDSGWDYVEKKQSDAVSRQLTASQIANASVNRQQFELEKVQKIEAAEDKSAGKIDEWVGGTIGTAAGATLGAAGGLAGLGLGLGMAIKGALAGAAYGTIATPIVGTIVGALGGAITGAAIGFGANELIEEFSHDDEYQNTVNQTGKEEKIANQQQTLAYKNALKFSMSNNEEYDNLSNSELEAIASINAKNVDSKILEEQKKLGINDKNPFTSGKLKDEDLEEWALAKGYNYKDGKVYDNEGKEVGTSDRKGMAKELAVFRAQETVEEDMKELSGYFKSGSSAFQEVTKDLVDNVGVEDFSKIISGDVSANEQLINSLSGEGGSDKISSITSEFLSGMSDDEKAAAIAAFTGKSVEEVAKSGDYQGQFETFLSSKIQETQANQEQTKVDFFEELARSGIVQDGALLDNNFKATKNYDEPLQMLKFSNGFNTTTAFGTENQQQGTFDQLDAAQRQSIVNISSSLRESLGKNGMGSQKLFEGLSNMNLDEVKSTISYFEGVDFSNPIQGAAAFRDALSGIEANDSLEDSVKIDKDGKIKGLIEELKGISENEYDLGSQFQFLQTSESFKNLSEPISELIEENGKLTADNILELAGASDDLAMFLENDKITADGLATALTMVETSGGSAMKGLTTATLAAISSTKTLSTHYEEMIASIEGFEPAIDTMAGADFNNDALTKIKEFIASGEYGNNQLHSYLDYYFKEGSGSTQKEIDEQVKQLEKWNKDEGRGFWSEAKSKNVLSSGDGEKVNVATTFKTGGLSSISVNKDATTDDIIAQLQEEFDITKEAATNYLAVLTSHSLGLKELLEKNDAGEAIDTLIEERAAQTGTENVLAFGEEELKVLAEKYGMAVEDLKLKIKEAAGEGTNITFAPSFVDDKGRPLSGQALVDALNTQVEGSDNTVLQDIVVKTKVTDESGKEVEAIDYLETKELMLDVGLNEEQATAAINQFLNNNTTAEGEKYRIEAEGKILPEDATAEDANNWANSVVSQIDESTLQTFAQSLANLDYTAAGAKIVSDVRTEIEKETFTVNLQPNIKAFKSKISAAITESSATSGTWYVSFYKDGSDGIPKDQIGMTGEEGIEIVQSTDGTARLVGVGGPELTSLKKGDKIYTAEETKKILKGKTSLNTFPAYAKGAGNKTSVNNVSGTLNGQKPTTIDLVVNIDAKLENVERQYKNGEMDAGTYQKNQEKLLTQKWYALQKDFNKELSTNPQKKYIYYDEKDDQVKLKSSYNSLDKKTQEEVKREYEKIKAINDELNKIEDELSNIPAGNAGSKGTSGSSDNNKTNNDARMEALERQYQKGAISAIDYQDQKKGLLKDRQNILQSELDKELSSNPQKSYFKYDKTLDTIILNTEKFNKLTKEKQEEVLKEYEKVKGINDELNGVEDELAKIPGTVTNAVTNNTTNEDAKLQDADRQRALGNISAAEYDKKKEEQLSKKQTKLQNELNSNLKKDKDSQYFNYDKKKGVLTLNEEEFSKLSKEQQDKIQSKYDSYKKQVDDINAIKDERAEIKKKDKYDTTNQDAELEKLQRQYEKGEISVETYNTKKNAALKTKQTKLNNKLTEELANDVDKDYFVRNEKTGTIKLKNAEFKKLSKEQQDVVREKYNKYKGYQDELNAVSDELAGKGKKRNNDVTNENAKLESLDRRLANGSISAADYDKERKAILQEKETKLRNELDDQINSSANKDMYVYNDATGELLLNQEKLNGLSEELQDQVKQEYETLKGINDEANGIKDTLAEANHLYGTGNEDASVKYLEMKKANGELSAADFQKAMAEQEQSLAAKAEANYGSLKEQYKAEFESGLLYEDENGLVKINETLAAGLGDEAYGKLEEKQSNMNNEKFAQYQNEQSAEERLTPGNQYDTTNMDTKMENLSRDFSKGNISAYQHDTQQKAQQLAKKENLKNDFTTQLNNSANYKDGMYTYDESTGEFLLNMTEFNKLSKEAQEEVKQEYETLKGINDQVEEIEDNLEAGQKYMRYNDSNQDATRQNLDWQYENGYMDPKEYQTAVVQNNTQTSNLAQGTMDQVMEDISASVGGAVLDTNTGEFSLNSMASEELLNDKGFQKWFAEMETGWNEISQMEDGEEKDAKLEQWLKDYNAGAEKGYTGSYYKNEQGVLMLDQVNWDFLTDKTTKDTLVQNQNDYNEALTTQQQSQHENDKNFTAREEQYRHENVNAEQELAKLEQDFKDGKVSFDEYMSQKQTLLRQQQDNNTKDFNHAYDNSAYKEYIKVEKDDQGNVISVSIDPDSGFEELSDDLQADIKEEIGVLDDIRESNQGIEEYFDSPDWADERNRKKYQKAEMDDFNAQADQNYLGRKKDELAQYNTLIGKLPSEIQGPLNLLTGAIGMLYTADESQILRRQEANAQNQFDAQWDDAVAKGYASKDGTSGYITQDEFTGEVVFDLAAANKARDEGKLTPEEYELLKQTATDLSSAKGKVLDIQQQRSGGIFQKPFYTAEKAAKAMSKAFKKTSNISEAVREAFSELEKELGLAEGTLSNFETAFTKFIDSLDLEKKSFGGLNQPELLEQIKNSKFGEYMSEDMTNWLGMIFGENAVDGNTFWETGLNAIGDGFGRLGDFMNFDMIGQGLDMANTAKGIVDQIKSKIEEIIGYITQTTQILVDAWTGREDYLYNFLNKIEKHLQDFADLQRYSTQLEKGRLSSSQDILNNWNEQWKSLQLQLEEQTERLETRQQELDRSRWNPFSLISGWDPTSDTLYENREVKMLWDIIIGLGEAFAPLGTGQFFSQLNQLYEDYDQRVQQSYEDRLAAEQALLDIEDERLELVKVGSDEATQFEEKVLEALLQKEQEAIDELTRLNDSVTEANSKLLSTLQSNLDKIRQDRENEKKEEELGEKERRLAYLRQDTSGANLQEIKKLEKELDESHEDYTDTLIDQKISELEKQNELAAEQRQKQIDLLQGQLEYAEKYGLYWDAIYGMLYTIDENGKAVLNSDNFDLDGNIRENSELAKLLGTFSDRMSMSTWSQVLDNEDAKRLGRYYGAFIGMNGVDGNWANYWALLNPGANDPNYSYPQQEIPDGLWGVLYNLEIGIKKYFGNSNMGLVNGAGRIEESFKNFFGKIFGYDEWANYDFTGFNPAHVESTVFAGIKNTTDDIKAWFASGFDNLTKGIKSGTNIGGTQNYGAVTENYNFNIGTVGESISLNEMIDKVTSAIKGLFTPNGVAYADKGH